MPERSSMPNSCLCSQGFCPCSWFAVDAAAAACICACMRWWCESCCCACSTIAAVCCSPSLRAPKCAGIIIPGIIWPFTGPGAEKRRCAAISLPGLPSLSGDAGPCISCDHIGPGYDCDMPKSPRPRPAPFGDCPQRWGHAGEPSFPLSISSFDSARFTSTSAHGTRTISDPLRPPLRSRGPRLRSVASARRTPRRSTREQGVGRTSTADRVPRGDRLID